MSIRWIVLLTSIKSLRCYKNSLMRADSRGTGRSLVLHCWLIKPKRTVVLRGSLSTGRILETAVTGAGKSTAAIQVIASVINGAGCPSRGGPEPFGNVWFM